MPTRSGSYDEKYDMQNSNFDFAKYHFIGIAISEYKHVTSLSNPVKDVEAVLAVLEAQYVFDKITLLKNEQATRANINNLLDEYTGPGKIGENDALLIYFAGHGEMIRKRGYWVPYDAHIKDPSSFLPNAQIIDILKNIEARHVLLISDSCFSGSLIGVRSMQSDATAKVLMQKKSRKIMTSGGQEVVSDGDKNSPFAAALISELQHNPDNFLIADKVFPALRDITRNINQEQTPAYAPIQGAGDLGGQFVFRRKGAEFGAAVFVSERPQYKAKETEGQEDNRSRGAEKVEKSNYDAFKMEMRSMIGRAQIEKALEAFLDLATRDKLEIKDEILTLKAKYASFVRKDRLGTLDPGVMASEFARTTGSLLAYLNELP